VCTSQIVILKLILLPVLDIFAKICYNTSLMNGFWSKLVNKAKLKASTFKKFILWRGRHRYFFLSLAASTLFFIFIAFEPIINPVTSAPGKTPSGSVNSNPSPVATASAAYASWTPIANSPSPFLKASPTVSPSASAIPSSPSPSPVVSPSPSPRTPNPPRISITFPNSDPITYEPGQTFCVVDVPAGGDTKDVQRQQNINNGGWSGYAGMSTLCYEPIDGQNTLART
jgi:hypothetical protein